MLEKRKQPCSFFRGFLMFRLAGLFLLSAAFLTVSTLGAAPAPKVPYYPLSIGTTWTYKTGEGNHFVMKVTKEEKVGDVPCMRIDLLEGKPLKEVGHEMISVTSDGVYRNAFSSAVPDKPVRILKLPLKAGDSWTIDGKALGDPFKGKFTVGEERQIEVPAGKYKAFPITSEDLDASGLLASTTSWYARDVGLIKQEIKINTLKLVIELEKFEAGK